MRLLKNLLFQLHWLLGITGGVVLAFVGFTGALLSFESELFVALNPGVATVAGRGEPLAPPDLLARVLERNPDKRVLNLDVPFGTDRSARVGFALPPGAVVEGPPGRRVEWGYVDPYTGELLGEPRGEGFFRVTRELHRYLAAGDVGKHIVGASTVALLLFATSGIYLRWPRKARSWRAWIHIDFRLTGRAFLYRLHAVVGTFVLPLYLLAALTGLTWSYEWYRSAFYAVLGTPAPQRPGGGPSTRAIEPSTDVAAAMQRAWPAVAAQAGLITNAVFAFPDANEKPVEVRYFTADAPHERAANRLVVGADGSIVAHDRYLAKPLPSRVAGSIFPLHRGSYCGIGGTVLRMLASVMMPLFAITGWMMYLHRRRLRRTTGAAYTGGGRVIAVSRSHAHTMSKPNELEIRLIAGLGVDGDAHSDVTVKHRSRVARDPTQPNLRQVHLIHGELHDELEAMGFAIAPGQMGENVTTRGIDLLGLPTGARLRLGDAAVIEVTGLRNPCGQLNGVQEGLMAATLAKDANGGLMRKAGVMAIVLESGDVRPGDVVSVELPAEPYRPLQPV